LFAYRDAVVHPDHVRLIRILVVDRHRGFAEALARRLDVEADLRAVGTVSTGAAAERAVDVLGPDVVILDMSIEDVSAVELTVRLTRRQPPVRVIGVFTGDDAAATTDEIRAGATAVVTKETSIADLCQALVAVMDGGAWVPSHLLSGVLRELSPERPPNQFGERIGRLTARERDVIDLMVAGRDRAAIAQELFLSINTVRTHTKNILAKLEVHSSLEAVSVALKARERAPA
jgi:DNA-binding NarL/FixJ family response regulator